MAENTTTAEKTQRLLSLDAFRGLTVLGMLLVNNMILGEATPETFTHADWTGRVHFADVVFPWFLLIAGVAIPYSMASHKRKGDSNGLYLRRALGRMISLFLVGCFVTSAVLHQPFIGFGVLQVIGCAYFLGALGAFLPSLYRGIIAGVLLLGHWYLLRFVPFPGGVTGSITEDGNIVRYLNDLYLTPFGLTGLLSVIPTTAQVLIGSLLGDLLRRETGTPFSRAAAVFGVGVVLAPLGLIWSIDLPMNKPLWTGSYLLFTAGLGAITMGILYLMIDLPAVQKWNRWSWPLTVAGANAIVAYVAPILVKVMVLQEWQYPLLTGTMGTVEQALQAACVEAVGKVSGGWLYTAGYILFWWLVLAYLYEKKVFVRL